jgi:tetratricopeptide (TPR) repeat protein
MKTGERIRLSRGISDYDDAIRLNVAWLPLYIGRAKALRAAGHRDLAIADYRKALQFSSANLLAQDGLKALGAEP